MGYVTIELAYGPKRSSTVKKEDIDENIAAFDRAVAGKSLACDFVVLADTRSMLLAIRDQLPKGGE